jgi:L-lactate dehydrogenase (cytochrome)
MSGSSREARRVASPRVLNIADLRRLAARRLPRVVFDYLDGAAEAEVTLRGNSQAFSELSFLPRSAVVTPAVDLRTRVLGTEIQLPIVLAPIGSTRMMYPKGEVAAARAAAAAGTVYTLSTFSGTALEEVRAASEGPMWYQVYLAGGRDVATSMLERVKQARFDALVVTIDTAVSGLRERDFRNGTPQLIKGGLGSLPYLPQILSRPGWLIDCALDGGLMKFPNVVLSTGPMGYADVSKVLEASAVQWSDLKWIRDLWNGPIVIKGVQTGDDARQAVDAGANAIVVSNHGGRQLDGVLPSLRVLPDALEAVAGRIEVLVDGGIRRGSDVVKALCLGARAVQVGRAYVYGLAAAGEPGVSRAIEILRTDMVRTMKLLGVGSVRSLDRTFVRFTH